MFKIAGIVLLVSIVVYFFLNKSKFWTNKKCIFIKLNIFNFWIFENLSQLNIFHKFKICISKFL